MKSDMSGSNAGFQRDFLDMSDLGSNMSGELYDRCNLNSTGLVRPFSGHVRVLTQLCHLREISSVSGLSRFGVFIPVWPVYWTGLLWQFQWLVFLDSYERHYTPLSWVAGSWPFAYSFNNLLSSPNHSLWDPSPLWRILVLGRGICVWAIWVQVLSTLSYVKHPWRICYPWRWSLLDG
jgi:hypothetical protein